MTRDYFETTIDALNCDDGPATIGVTYSKGALRQRGTPP